MLIGDSGAVYAFYDGDDQYHNAAREIINANVGEIILPDLILVEIDYLLGNFLGVQAELDFLQDVINGVYRLHRVNAVILQQCHDLLGQYRDLKLGLADAAVMTLAGELGIYRILTVDERDFRAVKLKKPLTLLPADN